MRSKTMRMRMWLAVSKPVSADRLLCLHTDNPVQTSSSAAGNDDVGRALLL